MLYKFRPLYYILVDKSSLNILGLNWNNDQGKTQLY